MGLLPLNLKHFAIRENVPRNFPRDFSGVFLGNARADPRNGHSLLEFSDKRGRQEGDGKENVKTSPDKCHATFFLRKAPHMFIFLSHVMRAIFQKKSRRLELSISKNTLHGRWGQGPDSVDPRFPAALPFPVPEILEFVAFRDLGKIFQQFCRDFPRSFLGNPRTDPRNSHSLLEFSEFVL